MKSRSFTRRTEAMQTDEETSIDCSTCCSDGPTQTAVDSICDPLNQVLRPVIRVQYVNYCKLLMGETLSTLTTLCAVAAAAEHYVKSRTPHKGLLILIKHCIPPFVG